MKLLKNQIQVILSQQNEAENTDDYNTEDEAEDWTRYKLHMVIGMIMLIEKKPKLYLGLSKNSFFLIKLLTNHTKLPVNQIYLVLKKIQLNLQFAIVAIDFCQHEAQHSACFQNHCPLSHHICKSCLSGQTRKISKPIC